MASVPGFKNSFSGLKKHLEDAQKRKEQEEADYIQRMVSYSSCNKFKFLWCYSISERLILNFLPSFYLSLNIWPDSWAYQAES